MKKLGFFFIFSVSPLYAKPSAPLPDTAHDGGVYSTETLGRGQTMASNPATPAAGSENPAALSESRTNATYATTLVNTSSNLDSETEQLSDPLSGKVLQYLSLQGEKGTIFFEPLSRLKYREVLDPNSPATDYRDVEYEANAIGIGGGEKFRSGSIGLSIAYLWSSIGVVEHRTGSTDSVTTDTADGLRMNIGLRYRTGPSMWGLVLQNAPGLLWGEDYGKELLPFRIRLGNTVKISNRMLFSADWERRYYDEGSRAENYVYLGSEAFVSQSFVLRAGLFGSDIDHSEGRRATIGASFLAKTGTQISYAMEIFEESNEKVKRSFVSLVAPFQASGED
ncbi:MAG: hypothetical protein KCHDKBKB_00571 [Elusimicrobia bacterium]|nr:hypothetical protein [Elusimicrobiota bacterium]